MSATIAVRVIPLPETVAKRAATKIEYTAALARWRKHPRYNTTIARHFVEDVHMWFRTSFAQLASDIRSEVGDDLKSLKPAWFEKTVLTYFRRSLSNLEGHHNAEDQSIFPRVHRKYPETAEVCEELERDHQLLHPLEDIAFNPKYDIEMRANAVIEFSNFLDDHLRREEMMLVPLFLGNFTL